MTGVSRSGWITELSQENGMGPTFIHCDVYARQVAKGKKTARTAREIVSEAVREVNHVHHLTTPGDPILLLGDPPDEVLSAAEAMVESERDPKGRKIRSDKPILLAGVSSFPLRWDELTPETREAYEKWKKLTVEFLRKEYGDNLLSVVEHTDEDRPHLHFYGIAQKASETRDLHPGHGASKGLTGSEAMGAYKRGCREFQDRYFLAVGVPVGLTREGPKRARLSRAEWKRQKEVAQMVAAAHDKTLSLWDEAKLAWEEVEATLQEAQDKTKAAMRRAVEEGKAKTKELIVLLEKKNKECDDTLDAVRKKFPNLTERELAALDARREPKPEKLLAEARKIREARTPKP